MKQRLTHTAYRLSLPLLRFYLRRTERVYAIVKWDDKVLAVRNWYSRHTWSLPGGGKRRSEGWHAALARELYEELGLTVDPDHMEFVAEGRAQRDRLLFRYKLFAINLPEEPVLHPRSREIKEAAFIQKNSPDYDELRHSVDGAMLE